MGLASGCKLQILHADQGCLFTTKAFVQRLKVEDTKNSWSGRGLCFANIRMERL